MSHAAMFLLPLIATLLCWDVLRPGCCAPTLARDQDTLVQAMEYIKENPETLAGLMDDDVAEGDMLLLRDRNAVDKRWPSTRIPYWIDHSLVSRKGDIEMGLRIISMRTCVSFHERTHEPDFIFFKRGFGCASYVGFIGGEQDIHVDTTCQVGNIIHEVLHALGFYHEHTRSDRGKHITIVQENIMKGHKKNFRMQMGETFDLPYDLPSIMHYGSTFFSTNGNPTIVARVKNKQMGQRVAMTPIDVQRIRMLYECDRVDRLQNLYWLHPGDVFMPNLDTRGASNSSLSNGPRNVTSMEAHV
ncbi:low choriolytic enzyme [Stigmatopora argus]